MAYNFNPNFSKHMNSTKDNYKFIKRTGEENAYSNPDVREMNNSYNKHKSPKLINFINNDNFEEEKMYKLEDIDNPNGWNFTEIDLLGEMNFRIDDEYRMFSEIEVPSLDMINEKRKTYVYKTDEGYVLEANRRYVFESFDSMIKFIDSVPMN
jgi:hypothetical protein